MGVQTSMLLVSAAGLIDRDGRVLMTTRPPGRDFAGLWEFPGGKVDDGETPEDALIRELQEELGVDTEASCLAPFSFGTTTGPLAVTGQKPMLLMLFLCRKWTGVPGPREGQTLRWIRPEALLDLDMPPVDRPLAAQLRDYLCA